MEHMFVQTFFIDFDDWLTQKWVAFYYTLYVDAPDIAGKLSY